MQKTACNAGVRSLIQEDPLEEETATHSSTLAWETPWTEESGGLQSKGLQGVKDDLTTKPLPPGYKAVCL